jgi:hypothetical protein
VDSTRHVSRNARLIDGQPVLSALEADADAVTVDIGRIDLTYRTETKNLLIHATRKTTAPGSSGVSTHTTPHKLESSSEKKTKRVVLYCIVIVHRSSHNPCLSSQLALWNMFALQPENRSHRIISRARTTTGYISEKILSTPLSSRMCVWVGVNHRRWCIPRYSEPRPLLRFPHTAVWWSEIDFVANLQGPRKGGEKKTYLLGRRVEAFPFPADQGGDLIELHVLHIAGGKPFGGEDDVCASGLFDEALIAEVRVGGLFAGFLGLLLQLVARVVGGFDFGGGVLAQPLLEGGFVLGFVFVGGVVEALWLLVSGET